MAMPMQVSLDEILSMLLARVDSLAINDENSKSKFNIVARVLYKKGILTDADIVESIKEEHRMLKELGAIAEEPSDDIVETIADGILQWIKGDVESLKKGMEEYERKVQEAMAKQQAQKPKIDVASPAVLQQLNRMGGKGQGGGKLII
ncbi:MAG TPA: hypothetical protein PK849_00040 [Synergistales bacterium]|jgi:uncharacterized protein YecA (UPF0149 family)|nr:hypothetical protein [Synergistaceae bacterium]MDD3915883.1 hypothetical protein [Synergistaceae bacterium]HPE64537.1 hypothetical protein [Synergistales bacterium]HPR89889.1 hypothetical protein [Synergistaceae bacterium]